MPLLRFSNVQVRDSAVSSVMERTVSSRTLDGLMAPVRYRKCDYTNYFAIPDQFRIMNRLCISDVRVRNKRVLMRVDFNVPLKDGRITNHYKIAAALPTIRHVLEKGAKAVILMSHLGRPEGRLNPNDSLKPVVNELTLLLGRKITFLEDCCGAAIEKFCVDPEPGSVILLENLRFHIEEEGSGVDAKKNKKIKADPDAIEKFRASLSKLGDVYVNDAFGSAHREHSSIVGVNLPVKACGLLVKKELEYFANALDYPVLPFLAILGHEKVEGKAEIFENLLDKVTDIIIVSGMAFTFLKVLHNMDIGSSVCDEDGAKVVHNIVEKAKERGVNIHLPSDFLTGDRFAEDANMSIATISTGIPKGWMGLDVGVKSNEDFQRVIETAKTIIWNGTPGVFEMENFSVGSKQMIAAVDRATQAGAMTIVCGRNTAQCVKKFNAMERVSYVSTGDGASEELLAGKVLAGVAELNSIGIQSSSQVSKF